MVISVATAFAASSLVSAATFLRSWQDNPTKSYLQNAVRSPPRPRRSPLRRCSTREVDPLILQRVVGPENLASHMFALVRDRPGFARSTERLRMLDSGGRVVDAVVTWVRSTEPGPRPQCGYFAQPDSAVDMPWTGRCCRRSGPPRSTTWPTARAAWCCHFQSVRRRS